MVNLNKSFNNDNIKLWNPMEIKWVEAYGDKLSYVWGKFPDKFRDIIIVIAVFIFGVSLKGEWLVAAAHCMKHHNLYYSTNNEYENTSEKVIFTREFLNDFLVIWPISNVVGYFIYFSVGGFLHWYFYVKQKDCSEKWKCQPNRWLSPQLELHEIIFGSISLLVTNTYSALLSCYVKNGGWSKIYYKFNEYTWTWWFLQWPVIFLLQDYLIFWLHRIYHTPYLYKHFHKLHHRYKQPTSFSVTAIHPVEILSIQMLCSSFIFIFPIHWIPFYAIAFYTYFNGIIDHSGIDFKAPWWQPWRPDTIFHDNHHQYFHVNFSFNCYFWDKLHGTYRRNDRIYNENIFYGKGKPLSQANLTELSIEKIERKSENPNAHRCPEAHLLPKKDI